jgi:hypothetical protein
MLLQSAANLKVAASGGFSQLVQLIPKGLELLQELCDGSL